MSIQCSKCLYLQDTDDFKRNNKIYKTCNICSILKKDKKHFIQTLGDYIHSGNYYYVNNTVIRPIEFYKRLSYKAIKEIFNKDLQNRTYNFTENKPFVIYYTLEIQYFMPRSIIKEQIKAYVNAVNCIYNNVKLCRLQIKGLRVFNNPLLNNFLYKNQGIPRGDLWRGSWGRDNIKLKLTSYKNINKTLKRLNPLTINKTLNKYLINPVSNIILQYAGDTEKIKRYNKYKINLLNLLVLENPEKEATICYCNNHVCPVKKEHRTQNKKYYLFVKEGLETLEKTHRIKIM